MASIDKLAIRGVRAFSPDDKEQVIEFFFPVTMIVGRNGCGKTTIIEALRYVVTGAFPPGGTSGKGGQNFVHDPRNSGHSTVKASVKLRFMSTSGKDYVVTRAMELTQKKTGVTFKQLDGVLRFTNEATGKTDKSSLKCGELDKQIPLLLGISKAVLDNVLFVHQEESSWPLQEGAVLKKRFDEIFDSTRYTKAVDVLRKTEKDLANDIKEIMIDLSALDARRDAIRAFKIELSEQQDIEEGLMQDKKQVQADLDALDAKLENLGSILASVDAVEGELDDLRREEHRLQTGLERQREMLENDLTGTHTLQEIRDMLRDFDEKVARHKEEERAVLDKEQALQTKIDGLHAREMELKSEVGKWAAKKEAHDECLKDRLSRMERLAQTYSMDLQNVTQLTQGTNVSFLANTVNESFYPTQDEVVSYELSPEAWAAFKRAVSKKKSELRQELKDLQDKSRHEDDKIQKDINELGAKIASYDHELSKIESRRRDISREKPPPVSSYSRLKQSDVEDYRMRAEMEAKRRQDLSENARHKDIPTEIRNLEQQMDATRQKLDEEKRVLETLRDTQEASNAIRVLEEECRKELGHLEESVEDEKSRFQAFNISPPKVQIDDDESGNTLVLAFESTGNFIRTKYDSQNSQLSREMEEYTKRQKAVSEVSALINRNHIAISTYKAQLSQIQSKGVVVDVKSVVDWLLSEGCSIEQDEQDPDKLLEVIDGSIATIDEKFFTDDTLMTREIASRLIEFLRKKSKGPGDGNFFCPCCAKPFESKEEKKAFKARLNELFADDSELMTGNQEARELKKVLRDHRRTVQSIMADLRDLSRANKEIEALEAEMTKLRVESESANNQVNDQKAVVDELQSEVNELRELLDSSKRWNEDANRIASKRMKISEKRYALGVDTQYHDRDVRTVEGEVTRLSDEKDNISNRINELNKEMASLNKQLQEQAERAEKVANMVKEKEAAFQKQMEDSNKRKELEEEEKRLKEEETKINDALGPLKSKLRQKETDKQRSREAYSSDEQSLVSGLSNFTSEVARLYELGTTIESYAQSDGPTSLERVEAELLDVAEKSSSLKEKLQQLQPEIARARGTLKNQEREKAQLEFNISILQDQERIDGLREEISKKDVELNKIEGYKTAAAKQAKAKARKEELQAQKAQLEGRYSEIVERIRSLKRKLLSPEYKDVPEQHRIATIKKETTKIAAEDLKKYEKALDQALLQYHSVKIAEVNKIIRELWTATYKGEDITNIEIMTSMDAGSKAAKSYNYRVVMTKGNTELDMRGRCSAGQRVLASLVIRLALAETFGVNCGCIALDEPTVNLDDNNKKGLAESLAQLVETRSKQKNFQLLLITHDEDFVTMMKSELQCHTGFTMPEHYFRVFREQASDGKYFSKIKLVDWDGGH